MFEGVVEQLGEALPVAAETNDGKQTSLGELAHLQQGKTLAVKAMRGGGHPVYGANGVIGYHDQGHYDHSVVAVGCRGSCGTIHIAPAGAFLGNNVMAVWPKDPDMPLELLACLLEAADMARQGVITGQVQPQLTKGALATLKVRVPPTNEWLGIGKMVAALDGNCTAAVSAVQATQRLLSVTRAVVLNADAESTTAAVKDVAEMVAGAGFPRVEQGKVAGDVPFLKVSDMNLPGNERETWSANNWVSANDASRLKAKVYPPGTVIFPKVGAALLTEKRRLLAIESTFDNNVMGLVARPEVMLSEYLFECMCEVRLGELAQHGAVPSVNNGIVGGIEVPRPALDRQREVVEALRALHETLRAARRVEHESRRIRAAILSALLHDGALLGGAVPDTAAA